MPPGAKPLDTNLESLHADVRETRADVKTALSILSEQGKTLASQGASLDEHIRRTEALEKQVESNREFQHKALDGFRLEIKPLTDREIVRASFSRIAAVVLGLLTAGGIIVEIAFHLRELH